MAVPIAQIYFIGWNVLDQQAFQKFTSVVLLSFTYLNPQTRAL
jgi:hypothetical protein